MLEMPESPEPVERPDPDVLYRALRSRDVRFDGRFFVGVTSTGIYCRPVCPARTPRRDRVRFYPSAAAAESAGFRPCRRCRPEYAPGSPGWEGASAVVRRALRLIGDGALDGGSVPELADRLGIGDRHLRRLFERHVGVSPRELAMTRRVHFARRLLDETDLSLTRIALEAGFGSARRLHAAVQRSFGQAPSELRGRRAKPAHPGAGGSATGVSREDAARVECPGVAGRLRAAEDGVVGAPGTRRPRSARPASGRAGALTLRLGYRKPFDFVGILDYLGPRAIPGVEEVHDGAYRRLVVLAERPVLLEVRDASERRAVEVTVTGPARGHLLTVTERMTRVFDLAADPSAMAALGEDRLLRAAFRRWPGLRVPGAWDPFELLVRAVLGQQVSVKGATTLAGRLVDRWGEPAGDVDPTGRLTRTFPTADVLASTDVSAIGMPTARGRALSELARRVHSGDLDLGPGTDPDAAREAMVSVPGIGPWTAGYVALRALGDPDAFLPGDLGVRKAMTTNGRRPTEREAEARAERWRPWRAYAVMALWRGDTT